MSFVVFSYFLIFSLVCASEDQTKINAKAGDNVPLQCQVSKDASVILLDWSRSDLKSHGYVFFFRENRTYNSSQLPWFHGRVELRDPEMKDGNVSVILKNVNINDTGTYECRVIISNSGHDETTHSKIKHLISLTVTASGETVDSDSGRTAGKVSAEENKNGHHAVVLSVTFVLLIGFVGVMVFMKRKKLIALLKRKNTYDSAGREDAEQKD